MSAGQFSRSFYEASYAASTVHPIRVQPETLLAAVGTTINASAATAATNPISAQISLGNRARGLKPRYVTLQVDPADPPAGYDTRSKTIIPAVTQAFWDACVPNTTVTYLTKDWTVISREPESAD